MNAKDARANAMPIRIEKNNKFRSKLINEISRSIGFAVKSGQLNTKLHPHKIVSVYEFSKQVMNEVVLHFRELGYVVDISYSFEDDNEQNLLPESFIKLSW
jgi:hypothetical protein